MTAAAILLVAVTAAEPAPASPGVDISGLTREIREIREEVQKLRRIAAERELPSERDREDAREALRTLSEDQPLHIEDADPPRGLELGLGFLAGAQDDHPRWEARPAIDVGFGGRFAVGGSATLGYRDGEGAAGPGELHAMWRMFGGGGVPAVALYGQGRAGGGEPAAVRSALIGTQELGSARVHLLGGFRVIDEGANAAEGAAGFDVLLGDRLLAGVAGWVVAPVDGSRGEGGGDVGVIARITNHFLVEGATGVASRDGELVPRVLFAIVWRG